MHEERKKIIKVVARAARYGGGRSGFPDITRYRAIVNALVFSYFPANGLMNLDIFLA